MADLLPSTPDTSAADESNPRVVGLDDEAADEMLAALSSETARDILTALHDDPAPPSDIADRVDTTLQNTQYHLDNLADAGLVEIIDTAYSEKGREMDIYAPADRPLVVFAGDQSTLPTLRSLIGRWLGALGGLAVLSLIIEQLFGDPAQIVSWLTPSMRSRPEDESGGDVGIESTPDTAMDAAGATDAIGLPPGVLFFLGGLVVLVALFIYRYWQLRTSTPR